MPGQDGTGPMGQGPLTGRGLGPCGAGMRPGFGRRAGFGRGFGFRGRAFVGQQAVPVQSMQPVVLTEKEEKQFLEADLKELKEEMKEIEKRLKELKE